MIIQAHRGNSGSAPENTLAAFKSALDTGADGIECDIHLTNDGRFVVCHDETIDRTSAGTGEIAKMTFGRLREYDYGYSAKFGERFRGEKIPALEEMLEIVRSMQVINIEIKQFADNNGSSKGENPYKKLCAMLHDFGVFDKVIISSFSIDALRGIYEADNKIYTAYLCSANKQEGTVETAASLKCRAIHPHFAHISYNYVRGAKAAGLAVNAWTANTREEILFCKYAGCDAVITDEPAFAREILFGQVF
jgi:glycerophosphoryl diester phosphodiesterase